MSTRFDLRPLINGLLDGLRMRRADAGREPVDVWSRALLFGVPGATFIWMIVSQVNLRNPEQLLSGAALLSAALIGAFAQIVSWRERILQRNREVERVKVRALNEAGAHVLAALVMSVIVTTAVFVLANLEVTSSSPLYWRVIVWVLSGAGAGAFAYVSLSLVIVANLLWDAFKREEQDITEGNSPQFPSHE